MKLYIHASNLNISINGVIFLQLDLPVPVIPPKPPSTQKSKTKYDEEEDDDDDDDSIYAKINDLDSHPSSPGEGAATVPLLNKNKANTLDSDVKVRMYKIYWICSPIYNIIQAYNDQTVSLPEQFYTFIQSYAPWT